MSSWVSGQVRAIPENLASPSGVSGQRAIPKKLAQINVLQTPEHSSCKAANSKLFLFVKENGITGKVKEHKALMSLMTLKMGLLWKSHAGGYLENQPNWEPRMTRYSQGTLSEIRTVFHHVTKEICPWCDQNRLWGKQSVPFSNLNRIPDK